MKFPVIALIVGLCLVVTVNANVIADYDNELTLVEVQQISNEVAYDLMEVEPQGLFSGIYWVLKGALRTLKGLNCAIQGVVNMKNASEQFLVDIHSCGVDATKQVQAVINSVKSIIVTCNNIIHMNTNICDFHTNGNANNKTGWKCFWRLLKQFITLKNQIQASLKLIKNVPTIGTGANTCVTTSVHTLTGPFTGFPAFVKNCSKLTSKN